MGKMEDSKKLQSIIDALGINANTLATKLQYKSHSSVYHVLDGKVPINSGMIDRIIHAFPIVSYEYLTKDVPPILLDEKAMIAQANAFNIPIQTDTEEFKIKRILQIPDQLDRIEEMLKQILNKGK